LVVRIKQIVASFSSLHYYHVLQSNNAEADYEANKVVGIHPGVLLSNEVEDGWDLLPWYQDEGLAGTGPICMSESGWVVGGSSQKKG